MLSVTSDPPIVAVAAVSASIDEQQREDWHARGFRQGEREEVPLLSGGAACRHGGGWLASG